MLFYGWRLEMKLPHQKYHTLESMLYSRYRAFSSFTEALKSSAADSNSAVAIFFWTTVYKGATETEMNESNPNPSNKAEHLQIQFKYHYVSYSNALSKRPLSRQSAYAVVIKSFDIIV